MRATSSQVSVAAPTDPIAVTLPEAARLLGCTTRAVRELIWAGKIPVAKLGKRHVVRPEDLRAFVSREVVRL